MNVETSQTEDTSKVTFRGVWKILQELKAEVKECCEGWAWLQARHKRHSEREYMQRWRNWNSMDRDVRRDFARQERVRMRREKYAREERLRREKRR